MAILTTNLSLTEAKACAQQAIELLLGHQLPPNPVNYAVAYEYNARVDSDLHRVLNGHLKTGKQLDEFLLGELYEQHIASDQADQFKDMRNDLQGILQSLMQNISSAGGQVDEYHDRLVRNIERLGSEHGPDALRTVASDLLESTLKAKHDNQALQSKLNTARQETERLRDELELHRREALIDPLTGLYNRRALERQIQGMWQETDIGALSVLALDIDHFKRINDNYGHAIGDVVLRHVADIMRKCIRGEDIAVRFGGEEFLILLPDTPLAGAKQVAETIRKRVEALRLTRRHDNLTLDPFTISLGVTVRQEADDHDTLFERADKALYHSKNSGRNRVTVAETLH